MRWEPAVRAAYGLFLLAAPRQLLRLGNERPPGWSLAIVRILGLRHLLQAKVLAAHPELAGPGAVVDGLHAASDIAFALGDRGLRVPALSDAAVASALLLPALRRSA